MWHDSGVLLDASARARLAESDEERLLPFEASVGLTVRPQCPRSAAECILTGRSSASAQRVPALHGSLMLFGSDVLGSPRGPGRLCLDGALRNRRPHPVPRADRRAAQRGGKPGRRPSRPGRPSLRCPRAPRRATHRTARRGSPASAEPARQRCHRSSHARDGASPLSEIGHPVRTT